LEKEFQGKPVANGYTTKGLKSPRILLYIAKTV